MEVENISGVTASQRVNQHCFTGCSHAGLQEFTHVIDSFGCWRIYQQSGAEFAPSLPAPTRDRALTPALVPAGCPLLRRAAREGSFQKMANSFCFHEGNTLGEATRSPGKAGAGGLVILVPSAARRRCARLRYLPVLCASSS